MNSTPSPRSLQNMYQGVVKDEARIAQKKKQRQAEMDEQQLRRAYLGAIQNVSDPSAPAPQLPDNMSLEELKKQDLKFDGCQTCKD